MMRRGAHSAEMVPWKDLGKVLIGGALVKAQTRSSLGVLGFELPCPHSAQLRVDRPCGCSVLPRVSEPRDLRGDL